MAGFNIEEAKRPWQEEPDDKAVLRAATEDLNEYPVEIQAIIQEEAKKRGLINEGKVVTLSETEKAIKPKKSGKERARRIALILIILGIIGKIARIAGGDSKIYMLDIILESLLMYWFVMYVGYPIARWIAGRWEKSPDEQKQ